MSKRGSPFGPGVHRNVFLSADLTGASEIMKTRKNLLAMGGIGEFDQTRKAILGLSNMGTFSESLRAFKGIGVIPDAQIKGVADLVGTRSAASSIATSLGGLNLGKGSSLTKALSGLDALQPVVRVDDEHWRTIIGAAGRGDAFKDALGLAAVSPRQWQGLTEAMRAPQHDFSRLMGASVLPRAEWRDLLGGIAGVAREHDAETVAEASDRLGVELDEVEPALDPKRTNLSWLLNLPFAAQLAVLYAASQVLDTTGQWAVVTFTDDELPPEVTTTVQVLFAVVGLLLSVAEVRGKPPDD